jgi:hypothetical protein
MISLCQGRSPLDVPFDVEHLRSDLAFGQIADLDAGRFDFNIVRFEDEWYLGDIMLSGTRCPF